MMMIIMTKAESRSMHPFWCFNFYANFKFISLLMYLLAGLSTGIVAQENGVDFTKTVSDTNPVEGTNVVFYLRVENTGSTTLDNLKVTDELPEGYVYVSSQSTGGNSYDPLSGQWFPIILLPGENDLLSITVVVAGEGDYRNTAYLSAAFLEVPLVATLEPTPQLYPKAFPDAITLNRGDFTYVNVLDNDIHPQLLPSSLTIVEMPHSGALAQALPDGRILVDYGNKPGFVGSEYLIYRISTTQNLSDTSKLFINVVVPEPYVPNTFSPNHDNIHDFWEIVGLEFFPGNELAVYNRWGNLVFQMKDYDNSWNGTDRTSGKDLPEGTYFYILTYDAQRPVLKGYVYIIR